MFILIVMSELQLTEIRFLLVIPLARQIKIIMQLQLVFKRVKLHKLVTLFLLEVRLVKLHKERILFL